MKSDEEEDRDRTDRLEREEDTFSYPVSERQSFTLLPSFIQWFHSINHTLKERRKQDTLSLSLCRLILSNLSVLLWPKATPRELSANVQQPHVSFIKNSSLYFLYVVMFNIVSLKSSRFLLSRPFFLHLFCRYIYFLLAHSIGMICCLRNLSSFIHSSCEMRGGRGKNLHPFEMQECLIEAWERDRHHRRDGDWERKNRA